MSSTRRISLGTLDLEGEEMDFTSEAPAQLDARIGETLELVVAYRYTEPSHDEDATRIVLSAELSGAKLGSVEERIHDEKLLDDTRRSYVSLAFRAQKPGPQELRFTVQVSYTRKTWDGGAPAGAAKLERSGVVRLRVA